MDVFSRGGIFGVKLHKSMSYTLRRQLLGQANLCTPSQTTIGHCCLFRRAWIACVSFTFFLRRFVVPGQYAVRAIRFYAVLVTLGKMSEMAGLFHKFVEADRTFGEHLQNC